MISQTINYTFKTRKGWKTGNGVKNDGDVQMLFIVTIKEMSYLVVGLFYHLVRPSFRICICDVKFFGCTDCRSSAQANKGVMRSLKTVHPVLISAY